MKVLRVDFEVSIDREGWTLLAKVSHYNLVFYVNDLPGEGGKVFTLQDMTYEGFIEFKKEIESYYYGYEVRFTPNGLSDEFIYRGVLRLTLRCAIKIIGDSNMTSRGGGWPIDPQDVAEACNIHEKCMEQIK